MIYGDEDIISQRIAIQAKESLDLNNAVTIDGSVYSFAKREFAPYFSMVIPESFEILDPVYARKKYPNEARPNLILSNEDTTVNMAFDRHPPQNEPEETRIRNYKSIIKRLNPSYVFFSDGTYATETNQNVSYYDFRSMGMTGDIYNFNFFTDLNDSELFGWFNCPIELKDKWEPLVRQMIQTIKPLPQEEQE